MSPRRRAAARAAGATKSHEERAGKQCSGATRREGEPMSERRKIGTRIAGMAKQAGLLAAVCAALAGSRGAHASPLAPIQPEAARSASAISGDYLEARTAD